MMWAVKKKKDIKICLGFFYGLQNEMNVVIIQIAPTKTLCDLGKGLGSQGIWFFFFSL